MNAVQLNDVSVRFPVHTELTKSFRHSMLAPHVGALFRIEHHKTLYVEALRNVSLSIKQGDCVGVVGHNGAGKSTFLKVLAGVYQPTKGQVRCEGEVYGVFDLSQGMHGERSGRENITLLALLRGRTRKDVEARMSDMIAFSDLGAFIDLPVRTYSSGMRLRLAFSVATCWQPDVLLLDEVIGVGDQAFMKSAQERLHQLIESSRVSVVATHSEQTVRDFCNRVLVLDHGGVAYFGDVVGGLDHYRDMVRR
jgi:lipopolysaccharide transport system ATP-binding protein